MLLAKNSISCAACEIRLQFCIAGVNESGHQIHLSKRSNGFGYTNLDHSRSHKIIYKKNEFGPFSYKFFVPIRVGPTHDFRTNIFSLRL